METSQDLIWRLDREGCFTYLNPAWEPLLGYRLEEMVGHTFTEFKGPEEVERTLETYKQVMLAGTVTNYETTYISKNGAEKILNFKGKPLLDPSGKIIGTQPPCWELVEIMTLTT